MPLYTFLHNLLNVHVQIANKMGLQKKIAIHNILVRSEVSRAVTTSLATRATQRNIREDGILYSHHRENPKSYIALTGWTL
jgi:hypothetical protein